MYKDIIFEKDKWVATITLNRPERMNAMGAVMKDELYDAFDKVENDQDIRVLVLTGAGDRAFSTGWDLKAPKEDDVDVDSWLLESDGVDLRLGLEKSRGLIMRIWNMRQPVITAVNGYAVAAGCNLALASDLTVAAETAQLGEPEIRQYSLAPVLLLPYLTHFKKAHEFIYTGDMISAQEACEMGLVNRVVPYAELRETAARLAWRVANVGAFNIQTQKRAMRRVYDLMGFSAAQTAHTEGKQLIYATPIPEHRELRETQLRDGAKAMLAKRDAPFKEKW